MKVFINQTYRSRYIVQKRIWYVEHYFKTLGFHFHFASTVFLKWLGSNMPDRMEYMNIVFV